MLEQTLARAAALPRLHALLVARHGQEHVAEVFRGPGLERAVNIKSVSKSVMAALAGAAIARGILAGVDQQIAPLLDSLVPEDADPRVGAITIDHLLTMRAGSRAHVGPQLRALGVEQGLGALCALAAVRRRARRTHALLDRQLPPALGGAHARLGQEHAGAGAAWLGEPLGIEIPPWTRDPQGIYLGGNNMLLSPRALLRFGEMYRQGGIYEGAVLPASWIEASWTPRVRSRFTGHAYGYGWFMAAARGHPVCYGWGYGGQMIYVVPDLALTVVMTSDHDGPSGRSGYVRELHALLADGIVPAAERGAGGAAQA